MLHSHSSLHAHTQASCARSQRCLHPLMPDTYSLAATPRSMPQYAPWYDMHTLRRRRAFAKMPALICQMLACTLARYACTFAATVVLWPTPKSTSRLKHDAYGWHPLGLNKLTCTPSKMQKHAGMRSLKHILSVSTAPRPDALNMQIKSVVTETADPSPQQHCKRLFKCVLLCSTDPKQPMIKEHQEFLPDHNTLQIK